MTLAPRPAATLALVAAVEEAGPPAPTILVFGSDISVGHPLVRMVGGTWAGSGPAQWLARAAEHRLSSDPDNAELRARMQAHVDRDRALVFDEMVRHRPDILIFDRRYTDWLAWARRFPPLAEAIRPYEFFEDVDGLEVWRRR